jgi:anaerobic magnesium-protoporphyrin IX monomethyl ester cyclase
MLNERNYMVCRVLLVNPPQKTRYPQPSLGLASLAAVLESSGHNVKILDMPALKLSELSAETILQEKPDIIGITAMTPTLNAALAVAKKVKETSNNTLVALGGPHATVLPEETLEKAYDLDFVIRGEGEQTFADLVNHLQGNKTGLEKVSGLTYRKEECVRSNDYRSLIADLDTLPFPAFHLLPLDKYRIHPPFGRRKPILPIITSRGCPYRCLFCSKSVFGKKYRVNSPNYVISEIQSLIERFGVREIKFYDDSFTLNRKRVLEICRLLKENKIDIQWTCETRVNLVDRDLLDVMKEAGCYMIEYGVESGVQDILNTLKKDVTVNQVHDSFKLTHDAGIETVAYFMIGSPGESVRTIEETISFSKKLDPDFAQFSIATPFPGTELYELALESGQVPNSWNGYVYADLESVDNPSFNSKLLSRAELGSLNKKAYMAFYLRWRYLAKRLKKMRTVDDFRTSVSGLSMLLQSVS